MEPVILVGNINKYIYFSLLINLIKCNFKKHLRDEQKLDVLAEYAEMDIMLPHLFFRLKWIKLKNII